MKENIALSVILSGLLTISSLNGSEDIISMFKEGKVSGQIRAFHIDREYQGTSGASAHRDSTAIGGHLKYVTDEYKGVSLGAAFYTTNGLFLHGARDDYSQNDMTLLGKDNESYTMLGEAYVGYKIANTSIKAGRMKFNSPMIGTDDARMIPNLLQGYMLTNTDIKDTSITLGHVSKFAQGTFGRVYNGGILSATSGYSAVDSRDQVGEFKDAGAYSYGESTDGITLASVTYTGIKNLKLQVWDYYAHDIANIIYGDVNFSWTCLLNDKIKPFVAAQFIKENDVGDSIVKNAFGGDGEIDSIYWAAKLGLKYNGFTTYAAYSQTQKNDVGDNAYENAILTSWGGMPAYTQGMVTRHQFLAGTKATKFVGSYSFKNQGVNLSTTLYYTSFKMDKNSGYGEVRTASESGFDIIHYPSAVKNLQLRFRGNFPRKFAQSAAGDTGWNEYRFIMNYNF